MLKKELLIDKKNIRTMSKDIARFQHEPGAGIQTRGQAVSLRAQEEKKERERSEKIRRVEEDIKRRTEDRMKQEEEELLRIRKRERLEEIEREKGKERQEMEEKKEQEKPVEKAIPVEKPPASIVIRPVKKPEKQMSREEVLSKEKESLIEEKAELKAQINKLRREKGPLELQISELFKNLEQVKKAFSTIINEERKIEEAQNLLEQKEAGAKIPQVKRKIEKERWKIEEKRRTIEKKRWPWDEKVKNLDAKIEKAEREFQEIESNESRLKNKQEVIIKKERILNLELGKIDLEKELVKIKKEENSFASNKLEINNKISVIQKTLDSVLSQEEEIEKKKKVVEQEEKTTEELNKKRELEKQRWNVEEQRRKIESKRWEVEEEKQKLESQLQRLNDRFKVFSDKKNALVANMNEIERRIKRKPEKVELIHPVKKEEVIKKPEEMEKTISVPTERDKRIEDARKRLEVFKKTIEAKKEKVPPTPTKKPIERTATIKRATEIEDLKKQEERRKEMLRRMESPLTIKQKPKLSPQKLAEDLIRVVPKKPNIKEKLWVRILIVAIVVIILGGVLTFWYWFFRVKNQPPEGEQETPPQLEEKLPDDSTEPSGITIPPSLFLAGDTRTISIVSLDDLSDLLYQTLQEWQTDDQFKRIIIKIDERIIGLREFSQAISIRMPDEFYDKIDDNFTLFIYSQPQGNRLGFVAKINDQEGFSDLVRARESTMEEDFKLYFELLGKDKPAIVSYFKSAENVKRYEGPNFRYQTLTAQDLGICYTVTGEYFVFTSSWKSMEKLLTRLEIEPPKRELTIDLQIGDRGDEVELLQTWLAKDYQVYPRGIISGFYGQLTRGAVIRFQEKYASEVLAPQGLEKGTGQVDSFTRNKLNELYSIF